MTECIYCHSQSSSGAVHLTCSHFICTECFKIVKCDNLVFCGECSALSRIKEPDLRDRLSSTTDSNVEEHSTWEEATASKFSFQSPNNDRSTVSPTHRTAAGSFPLKLFLPSYGIIRSKYSGYNKPPDYFWCSIVQPLTPRKFVVQVLDEELERFKVMHAEMQKFYNSKPEKEIRASRLRKGCYIIKYKGVWHRASAMREREHVAVSLLDSGDRYWLHIDDSVIVESLQPQFQELPAQAVHCNLDVLPDCRVPPSRKTEIGPCRGILLSCWKPECLDLLKRKTNSTALCLLTKNSNSFNDLKITLYVDGEEKSLNQQIVENGWARNDLVDHIEHFKALDEKHKEIIGYVPAGIPPNKERESKSQWTNAPCKAWPRSFNGVVTWVDDTGGVYIHTVEWSSKLIYIRDRLKEIFAFSESSTDSLEVGDCCFVKYKGNWFRAILNSLTSSGATVFLVDFGVLQEVAPKALRRKDVFFKIPVQTYRCMLDGITPIDERGAKTKHLTESAVNLLHDVTVNNEFRISVVTRSPLRVSLRCQENDVDIADLLVAARKARYR